MLMFTNARLKLTFWYFVMITLLTGSITTLFYIQTGLVLTHEYDRIERRLQRESMGQPMMEIFQPPDAPIIPGLRRLLPGDITLAREKILWQLIFINIGIIGVFTGIGYWWAGRTLAPIQAAHESQQRFIGDAAHELKTPITAMRTALEVNLMAKDLGVAVKKVLTENLSDVKALENLIQNLLQLTQLQERQTKLIPVDLVEVVTRAEKLVRSLAGRKKIQIQLFPEKIELKVLAQPAALVEILIILLDNAIKYSCVASLIKLKISQSKHWAVIQVIDTGLGMSPDQLQHIFERFYRADSARNKQNLPGFGLGLAIAKELIQLQKGQISVTSKLNYGSTFTLKLPLI